jgi:predicted nucleotidyltransferase
MLTHDDQRILEELANRVRERYPEARIWAYGSRARGTATWDSDFDVFIVLARIDQNIDRWIRDLAWKVGFDNDRVITTVVMNQFEFEQGPMSESTLVGNILLEGIAA